MANLAQLTKLFRAISLQDWQQADTVAHEIASSEEDIGHHGAAQRLRGALNSNGRFSDREQGANRQTGLTAGPGSFFLSDALLRLSGSLELDEIQLQKTTRKIIEEVIAEWYHRNELAARQLVRRTKLLFHGPPGCGKSATARALGFELGLPVYVVRFDSVVGAYLGQTALHLRQLFRFAENTPCIVLVDEIDALGKRRGSPLDVGELDRVVIALLQELEHSRPAGLLIATSNLAKQLDDALWRRFDLVLEFPLPNEKDLASFARSYSRKRGITLTKRLQASLSKAKSYADAERLIDAAERRLVLEGR